MVHENWREAKIGDLILSANAGVYLLGEDRVPAQGDVAILTLSSVSEGLFRPDEYKVVNGHERDRLVVSPKRDRILISRSNTPDLVGAAVYVDRDYPDRFLPDLIWQLEPNTEQDFSMRWLCYWLQSCYGPWEDLVAVHEKWVLDYNFQKHLAHEKREDGRRSPAEVLGWVTGKQFEPDDMYRAFSAICETRTLTSAGYARFRDFLLYGERGLAGKKALINIFQDTLALEYGEHPLAKYSVEWQPDDKHLLRVGNPRLYDHPYQSPQLELWPSGQVEWFVIIKAAPYGLRPRRKPAAQLLVIQPPLLTDGTQGRG